MLFGHHWRTRNLGFLFALIVSPVLIAGAHATTLTTLKSYCTLGTSCFTGTALPQPLIADGSGNYFGATFSGGTHGHGAVFELAASGGSFVYHDLYDFCPSSGCVDGNGPVGGLVLDTNGNIYGTTGEGGTSSCGGGGCGTVYKLHPTGTGFSYVLTTLYDFCSVALCADGNNPDVGLTYVGAPSSLYDGTSALYGTAIFGGANGEGVTYEITGVSTTPTQTVIYAFCPGSHCTDGEFPHELITDSSGNLYGTTDQGGSAKDDGVVYELSPAGGGTFTHTTLWTFCDVTGPCTDAAQPSGSLLLTSTGKLFGVARLGGANNGGAVYRIVPNGTSSTESVRYSFCSLGSCADGDAPSGGLVLDSGDLYGTANAGGANNAGTVFKLSGTTLTTLYSFCALASCADGSGPDWGVVRDGSGNLFGGTDNGGSTGGGTSFELTP